MRILLCHNYYQRPGGEDQVFHDERSLLEENGHEVIVYTKHNNSIVQLSTARVIRDSTLSRLWNESDVAND